MADLSTKDIRLAGVARVMARRFAYNRFTFKINRGDPEFDIEFPVMIGADVDDVNALRIARNALHRVAQAIADGTSDWRIEPQELDALQPKREGQS